MSSHSESSAEVQREVETERAELVSTLDQLRENLKPANVVDEVMASAKVTTTEVTDRIWSVARNNPIPAVLIGIGALMLVGVGGKMRSRAAAKEHDWEDDSRFPRTRTRATGGTMDRPGSSYRRAASKLPEGDISARLQAAGSRAAAAAAQIADSAHSLRDQAAGRATALRHTIKSMSGDTSMSHHSRSRNQIGNSLTRLIDEQPLVLAALGVAVGAAIGAAIPSTETESRLMGDASGQLKSRAQELAAAEYEHLKETAGSTFNELKQTAADHGVSAENLQGLVQDAGSRVRDAAHDVTDHAAGTAGLKA